MATAATVQATTTKTKRDPNAEPKTFTVTLVDDGGGALRCRAVRLRDGWRTEVVHRASAKAPASRGASSQHAGEQEAKAHVEKLVAAAEKAGWKRREARGVGFARRPDAFSLSALPKPAKAVKK